MAFKASSLLTGAALLTLTLSSIASFFLLSTPTTAIPTTLTALGNFTHTSPEGARLITLCSSPQPSSPLDEACSTLLGGGGGGGPSLITKRDCNWQGDNICRQCHDNVAQCYYCDEGDIVQDDFGVALACASW
ncbi:hypothetical protein V8F33_009182 [Rhypophila sp. PSN 637]